MSVKIWGILLLAINGVSFAFDSTRPIKICLDNANWRPFIYIEDKQVKGLHIDTIQEALEESEITYEFVPTPWKRCLKGAEKGMFDAIATASYNTERSQYLLYPNDATTKSSSWHVGQVQYNIIVHQTSDFDYQQELKDIPLPIRVPRDYSIGKDLKSMGFKIDDSSINDMQNIKRLLREKNGSVVALPSLVDWINQQQEYAGKIRLIEKPLKSKSYFLAFSKLGRVNTTQAELIWQQIKDVRERNHYKVYLQ